MDQKNDPRVVFTSMHHKVTGELLHLMDGFYSNIEDGLFELAYRSDESSQQKRCFDLMREMRYRRANLVQTFAKRMQQNVHDWFEISNKQAIAEVDHLVLVMSQKCSAHFGGLLQEIAERTAYGTGRDSDVVDLPISPYQISYNFIMSCRSLEFDQASIEIVQELFGRFVLDRMGSIYGECNARLIAAHYQTLREIELASMA